MVKQQDDKEETLKEHGVLNPQPEKVTDELFLSSDFFDPRDLVQVKYEMVRRVVKDNYSVSLVSQLFGFSRPTFYQLKEAFGKEGLPGFLPRKRGPKSAHKLDKEVMAFIEELVSQDPSLRPKQLAGLVENKFGYTVHPRSIERALDRRKKNAKKERDL
jgi:transposase